MKKNALSPASLSAFLLFCLFAVGMASLLFCGARLYRRTVQRDQLSFDSRTAQQYFATRIRQAPEGVALADFAGTDALVLPQDVNGQTYLTRIYCHEGWLMELFTRAGGDFSPEDGERLLQLDALSLALSDGLLTVTLTPSGGESQTLFLEVAP